MRITLVLGIVVIEFIAPGMDEIPAECRLDMAESIAADE